jgi:type IV pilus assembly protein PilQ
MRLAASRLGATISLSTVLGALLVCEPAAASGKPDNRATQVAVTPDTAGGASVRVEFMATPTYTARLESSGLRLIVDVPNAQIGGASPAVTEAVGVVGGVLVQTFKTKGQNTTRVLVTLRARAKYAVAVEGNSLVMRFAPGGTGVLDTPAAPKTKTAARPAAEPRVMDVQFSHGEGEDRIAIDLSEAAQFRETQVSPTHTRLTVVGAKLPEELERTLDVSAFDGRISAISSYRQKDGAVVFDVERRAGVEGLVTRRGTDLVWKFYDPGKLPTTVSGVARDGLAARKSRTVSVEPPLADASPVEAGYAQETRIEPDQASGFASNLMGQQRRVFTGRRIDLDLKDADIHNVLRLLADVGQVNIVTSDNVAGTITIRMRNVPWDQALDVVLQSKGLGMVRQANMIRVAPLADLDKERELQLARRQAEVNLAPLETRLIPISYANAATLQARAQPLLSPRGSIAVDERTNVLIVRDLAGNLNQIEELTRSLDTQTPQVLVEARIVEANSNYVREVGIQWGGDATFSGATGNPTGLTFPNSIGLAGGASDDQTPTQGLSPFTQTVANPNFAVNLPAAVGAGRGGALGLTFGSINNNFNLSLRLSAAEVSGMVRILSSPRILTLDNSEARISQGTLIPFSQVSAQGVQTTFQEAKLQLLVRPHVTADGSVSMHVKINRDEPDFNQTSARGEPTILKREAETDLLVMDGHTAVIGGIYTRNTGRNLDQVPFFGDIPLLGLLFQRRRANDTRTELVIFLTPRIVNRAEALGR